MIIAGVSEWCSGGTHASNDVAALQPHRGVAGQQHGRITRCYISATRMILNTIKAATSEYK
jgi:hypothetical protein